MERSDHRVPRYDPNGIRAGCDASPGELSCMATGAATSPLDKQARAGRGDAGPGPGSPRAPFTPDHDLSLREQLRVFCRFFRYLHPYRDKVILGVLLLFVGVPIGQVGFFLGRYQVDNVLLSPDRPTDERFSLFFGILALQAVMWLIATLFGTLRWILGWYIDMRVSIDLRKRFYDHLQRLPIDFFRTRPIGEHMYRTTADVGAGVVTMITHTVPDIVDAIYNVTWGAILLSLVDGRLTLLVLGYLLPHTAGSQYFYGRLKALSFAVKARQQREVAVLRDGIAGAKTLKASGRTKFQTRKYLAQVIRTRRADLRYMYTNILTHDGVLWTLQWIFDKWIWFYVTYRVMTGSLTIGEWSITFWLLGQFKGPMERLVRLMQGLRLQMVPAQRMLETMDVAPSIHDLPTAVPLPRLRGTLEFRNVSFEYVPGKPVLKNLSFTIPAGATAAFVGPSGAGKSTIMHLALRLHDPAAGQVLVDGHDLKAVALQSYLEQVAIVPQTTFLFGCTVGENIRYGRLDATDDELRAAAGLAEIDSFIAGLPQGYETHLGEGTKLSGGQKQRIGIARALIRDPRLLILDEATANLDPRAEAAVLRTLDRVRAGRTVLCIAHRLQAVVSADVIFVLQEGRIVDQGTHEELIARPGLYQQMWEEQSRAEPGSSRRLAPGAWPDGAEASPNAASPSEPGAWRLAPGAGA
jgi:ATP-binding cassette, subfamily B, bacterial MsbA